MVLRADVNIFQRLIIIKMVPTQSVVLLETQFHIPTALLVQATVPPPFHLFTRSPMSSGVNDVSERVIGGKGGGRARGRIGKAVRVGRVGTGIIGDQRDILTAGSAAWPASAFPMAIMPLRHNMIVIRTLRRAQRRGPDSARKTVENKKTTTKGVCYARYRCARRSADPH